MDRGVWQATVQGSQRVGHDWAHTHTHTPRKLTSSEMFHHSFCNDFYYEATVLSTVMIFFFFDAVVEIFVWSCLELRREKSAMASMERRWDWSWCSVHPGVSMSKSRELRIRGGHCPWTTMHLVKVCLSLASKTVSRKPCAIGLAKLFQSYSVKASALSTLGKFSLQSSHCCSVANSCLTLCNPMNCSMPGSPVLHYLLEFAQIYIHWVSDSIQPSHPLLPPSPFAFNLSQHPGLFQWIGSSHQVAKVLELQLQHQSFQWVFGVDFP